MTFLKLKNIFYKHCLPWNPNNTFESDDYKNRTQPIQQRAHHTLGSRNLPS